MKRNPRAMTLQELCSDMAILQAELCRRMCGDPDGGLVFTIEVKASSENTPNVAYRTDGRW